MVANDRPIYQIEPKRVPAATTSIAHHHPPLPTTIGHRPSTIIHTPSIPTPTIIPESTYNPPLSTITPTPCSTRLALCALYGWNPASASLGRRLCCASHTKRIKVHTRLFTHNVRGENQVSQPAVYGVLCTVVYGVYGVHIVYLHMYTTINTVSRWSRCDLVITLLLCCLVA